jgi:hypothetical protein
MPKQSQFKPNFSQCLSAVNKAVIAGRTEDRTPTNLSMLPDWYIENSRRANSRTRHSAVRGFRDPHRHNIRWPIAFDMAIGIAGMKPDSDTLQTKIFINFQAGPEICRDRRSLCNTRTVKLITAAIRIVPAISEHISPVAKSQVVTCQQFAILPPIRRTLRTSEGIIFLLKIANIVPIKAIGSKELVPQFVIPIIAGFPNLLQILIFAWSPRTRFDYIVTVTHPIDELYVNVWFDWNRDGDWDDVMDCGIANDISNKPRGLAREWAVRNQVLTHLPAGIHKIETPAFMPYHLFRHFADVYRVDPIWMRITISERPWGPVAISNTYKIGTGGSGSIVGSEPNVSLVPKGGAGPRGGYKIGETEDYFFVPTTRCIQEADLNCSRAVDFTDFAAFASQWLSDSP